MSRYILKWNLKLTLLSPTRLELSGKSTNSGYHNSIDWIRRPWDWGGFASIVAHVSKAQSQPISVSRLQNWSLRTASHKQPTCLNYTWSAISLLCSTLSLKVFPWAPVWRKKWQPTPVFLPGKSHGQRRVAGCCPWARNELDATELLHLSSC